MERDIDYSFEIDEPIAPGLGPLGDVE